MERTALFFLFLLFLFVPAAHFGQDGGALSGGIKFIQADKFTEFSGGFAVITNKGQTAVINAKGDIVLPFGKYLIHGKPRHGIYVVSNSQKDLFGYINSQFKSITPLAFKYDDHFRSDGYASNAYILHDQWFQQNIDKNGKTYQINERVNGKLVDYASQLPWVSPAFREGLVSFSYKSDKANSKFGFLSRSGAVVIPPQFDGVGVFREGLAPVLKKGDNGFYKWGFIDKTGKLVIPYTFDNMPSQFCEGLCLIKFSGKEDFNYAYVNNKNEIVVKLKMEEGKISTPRNSGSYNVSAIQDYDNGLSDFADLYGNIQSPFQGDYAIWANGVKGPKLVDKKGQIKDVNSMVMACGIDVEPFGIKIHQIISDEQIIFYNRKKFGMMKTDGTLTLPPVFDVLTHFDPVAKLAYAKRITDNGVLEGYIDTTGKFVIVSENAKGINPR